MKKTIFGLVLLAVLVPSFALADFSVSLKFGSRGDAVSDLQDFLNDQGVYTGKVDGKFGFGTLKAVKAFQSANGLSVDGYFGLASRNKANTILASLLADSNEAEKAETGTVTTNTSTVAGCTSTAGFSVTTGLKCDGTPSIQTQLNSIVNNTSVIAQNTGSIVENTTPPVNVPPPVIPPVVTPPPVQPPAPVIPQSTVKVFGTVYSKLTGVSRIKSTNLDSVDVNKTSELIMLGAKGFDPNGKQISSPITVTTDDPDLPSTFTIKADYAFYVGDHHQSGIIQDANNVTSCSNMPDNGNDGCIPVSTGTFNFTFTNSELNASKSIQVTVTQ